jgi:hypothetical protein
VAFAEKEHSLAEQLRHGEARARSQRVAFGDGDQEWFAE